jgi:hypothetical protein
LIFINGWFSIFPHVFQAEGSLRSLSLIYRDNNALDKKDRFIHAVYQKNTKNQVVRRRGDG